MKNICIIFAGGQYGTFVEWCLNYFTDLNFPSALPFTSNGNSHKFIGNHLHSVAGCKQFVESDLDHQFVRCHLRLKYNHEDDPFDDFEYIYNNFNQVIFLYSTKDSLAWCINNKFEKIDKVSFLKSGLDSFNNVLKNWGNDKKVDNADIWELREMLSYYVYPQYTSEASMDLIDEYKKQYKNALFVSVDELRDDFELTITQLLANLKLPAVRNNFLEIYNAWISLQKHRYKDKLIKKIVDTIIQGNDSIDWQGQLTLIDEALIQRSLREQGIELKCYKLDVFPTNTDDLKKVIL